MTATVASYWRSFLCSRNLPTATPAEKIVITALYKQEQMFAMRFCFEKFAPNYLMYHNYKHCILYSFAHNRLLSGRTDNHIIRIREKECCARENFTLVNITREVRRN